MIKIRLFGKYTEELKSLILEDSAFEELVERNVNWFLKNPNDTRLDNHSLTGKMDGQFAFSITDDIRIVYVWIGKSTARFLAIGHHKKVYPR